MNCSLAVFSSVALALGAVACSTHELARTRWHELSGYKPGQGRLVEVQEGAFYLTPKQSLTFALRDGREITRKWQEISLAKGSFTVISLQRETFTFPLSDISRIVGHGKLAGELTGVVVDRGGGPPQQGGGAGMGRPMF